MKIYVAPWRKIVSVAVSGGKAQNEGWGLMMSGPLLIANDFDHIEKCARN